jgi:D-alanyl-D-alanine carboxypeptidase
MTTPQMFRPDQRARVGARRYRVAALVAALATVLTVAGPPGQAAAAVPQSAQKWASLMYHSLTPSPAYVQLRKTLAAQRATLATRATQLVKGRAAHKAAQAQLTTAVTADASARIRSAVARETLTSARNGLVLASQRRPLSGAAVTQARNAISAAAQTVTANRTQAREAAAVLKTAQTTARTTTAVLDKTIAAWRAVYATIQRNQQKLISLDRSAEFRGQAAALSRTVVTEVRRGFTVADTTTVSGITVHKNVAFAFRRMLADAKADGIVLSGGGFRTKQRQIELRKINGCPDIWTAPASSCRVPTAIPGRSLHELGLAVDLTTGGRSLTGDSAAFRWLATNAARYGYVNLPSEAWHWSITGG